MPTKPCCALQVCDVLKLPMTFIAIVEQESFFLKCTQRERDHILKHNNVFPRTMGMPQWVLAAEIKQMLVVDKRLDDIGYACEMQRCHNSSIASYVPAALELSVQSASSFQRAQIVVPSVSSG